MTRVSLSVLGGGGEGKTSAVMPSLIRRALKAEPCARRYEAMTASRRPRNYRPVYVLPESDPDHGYPWVLVVHTDDRRVLYPAMTREQAAHYLTTGQFAPKPGERMLFEIVEAEQVEDLPEVDVAPHPTRQAR